MRTFVFIFVCTALATLGRRVQRTGAGRQSNSYKKHQGSQKAVNPEIYHPTNRGSFLIRFLTANFCAPGHAFHCLPILQRGSVTCQRLTSIIALAEQSVDIVDSIERRGVLSRKDRCYRVTAADVAADCGCELAAARSALTQLTAELGGAMEVTQSGHMLYVFPKDSRQRLGGRKQSKVAKFMSRARTRTLRVMQATVGLMLVASTSVVRKLLPKVEEDARLQRRSSTARLSFQEELQELRRYIAADSEVVKGSAEARSPELTPLALACFSFMFGNGGLRRSELEDLQWAAMAQAIRANKGAVCAEQLRPFLLDPRGAAKDSSVGRRKAEDQLQLIPLDNLMLPVVARFDGRPVVTDDGDIVYTFPELLKTTTLDVHYGKAWAPLVNVVNKVTKSFRGPKANVDYLDEPFVPFMRVRARQPVVAVALTNWAGVIILGALLGPLQLAILMGDRRYLGALTLINVAYAGLLINGFCWLMIPLVRGLNLLRRNMAIAKRNQRRRNMAKLLGPERSSAIGQKLLAAKKLRPNGRQDVRQQDVTYTTAKTLLEQSDTHGNPVMDSWDLKLEKKHGS